MDEHSQSSLPKWLIVLTAAGALVFVVAVVPYVLVFGSGQLSTSQDLWGQFGDYLAGTVGPLIAFLAFVGLLWTIHLNQRELRLTKDELELSREALQRNNKISASRAERERIEAEKNDLVKVIMPLTEEIEVVLDTPVFIPNPGTVVGGSTTRPLRDLLTDRALQADQRNILDRNLDVMKQLATKLSKLEEYLRAYELLADGPFFTAYYKAKYTSAVNLAVQSGRNVTQAVVDFFQQPEDVVSMADASIKRAERSGLEGVSSTIRASVTENIELSDEMADLLLRKSEPGQTRELPHVSVHTYPKPNDPSIRLATVSWAYESAPPRAVPPSSLAIEKQPMDHDVAMEWGKRIARGYGFPTLYWQRDD